MTNIDSATINRANIWSGGMDVAPIITESLSFSIMKICNEIIPRMPKEINLLLLSGMLKAEPASLRQLKT